MEIVSGSGGGAGFHTAPSTQMLRYLRRVDDVTEGRVRWGILTNGECWRLYYAGARSVSDQFFEINLNSLFQGKSDDIADDGSECRYFDHWLRVFVLMFRRASFAPTSSDNETYHLRALTKGKYYEERVTQELSKVVFNVVFPNLARTIAAEVPKANLIDVRHATLILLYRLLFLFHAEDRNLLPVDDDRYRSYALRRRIREDIKNRKEDNETFSDVQDGYWQAIDSLAQAIDGGDSSIGLPPYNGGLFDRNTTPILNGINIPDSVLADVIVQLSYEHSSGEYRYINYRDLSVQQLGSIYEGLLEFELWDDPNNGVSIRPNPFARKVSGSYYTPDSLVSLVLKETLEPLIRERREAFVSKASELAKANAAEADAVKQLQKTDIAEALLCLRICDPAMGSGHFLVNLVDYLSEAVIEAIAEVKSVTNSLCSDYTSPVTERIDEMRDTIIQNAEENGWELDSEQLNDRHIIRRIILKRCVYGVDKNPMAVELAKVSLWLHTFTAGAPLSFLDHHLRCGDSLFGETVERVLKRLNESGQELLIASALKDAWSSAESMQDLERLADAEITEANKSAEIYKTVKSKTAALDRFMKLYHAMDWLFSSDKRDRTIVKSWLDGRFGDPVEVAENAAWDTSSLATLYPSEQKCESNLTSAKLTDDEERFAYILNEALKLAKEERFFNWEIAFPGVWNKWKNGRVGGFDALIGNPPWEMHRFNEIPWFASRDPEISKAERKSEREKKIKALRRKNAPLWNDYQSAKKRIKQGMSMMKSEKYCFEWTNTGNMDLYKIFTERATQLVSPTGLVGFIIKSGIATDLATAPFFRDRIERKSIKSVFGFFNKELFSDVHKSERPCVFVTSGGREFDTVDCAYGLYSPEELADEERCYQLSTKDFSLINPNSGTAPVFAYKRDQRIVTEIYHRIPVLHTHGIDSTPRWPITFRKILDVSKSEIDATLRTEDQLTEKEKAYPIDMNRFQSADEIWLPLYEGKMTQAYDHRAASIRVNTENMFRQGQKDELSDLDKRDPDKYPSPHYYVGRSNSRWPNSDKWIVAFKEVTATTNMRTMIATILPECGASTTMPVLFIDDDVKDRSAHASLIVSNLNSISFDFIARQKVPGVHFNWYVLEQLPVITLDMAKKKTFGSKSAQQVISEAVLKLVYTSYDMAPFAQDMGYVDETGCVLEPFLWDAQARQRLMAKIDAVYFHLYGIFDPTDIASSRKKIRYIYSTFPIFEKKESKMQHRSSDLALAYCNTLASGHPESEPEL